MTAPPAVTLATVEVLHTHHAIGTMEFDPSSQLAKVMADMVPLPDNIISGLKKVLHELPRKALRGVNA